MNEPGLERAGEWLRTHVEPAPADHARRRAELVEACAHDGMAKSRTRWMLLALPAAALMAGWLALHVVYRPTIEFTIGAEKIPGTVGAFVAAPPGSTDTELQFSDGSSVALEPETRVRVAETSRHGAHLSVEDGRARVDIVHRTGTCWAIAAGPYTVDVLGTSFDMGWSGATSTLDLSMRQGVVEVRGPGLEHGATVRAPEHFTARAVGSAESVTTRATSPAGAGAAPGWEAQRSDPPTAVAEPPLAAPTAVIEPLVAAGGPPPASCVESPRRRVPPGAKDVPTAPAAGRADDEGAAAARSGDRGAATVRKRSAPGTASELPASAGDAPTNKATTPESWSGLASMGRYRDIVADAERRGVETSLATANDAELIALGNAARYTGRPDLARRALLAVRNRFAGSIRSASAAFLLGRTAEDTGHGSDAVGWYDRYLDEAPNGALAAEALGRAMVGHRGLGQHAAAQTCADAYLKRFPGGPYAATAREVAKTH